MKCVVSSFDDEPATILRDLIDGDRQIPVHKGQCSLICKGTIISILHAYHMIGEDGEPRFAITHYSCWIGSRVILLGKRQSA